jgi:8-oxo-dGTP diphosphatase
MIFEGLFFGWLVPGNHSRRGGEAPVLARFLELNEVEEAGHETIASPSFAVVLAHAPAGVVLVFNRYRKVWELPGGLIDAGETPRVAAARELAEESGCVAPADALEWLGLVSVEDESTHHGAVFRARVNAVPESFESEETGGVAFWQAGAHPQPLGETDRALLARFG